MDVLAVREATKYARQWCLDGKGPLVLEVLTYRYGGHSMSDPGTTYRTREEIQHMRSKNDPIMGLKQQIIEKNVATETDLKNIDKSVKTEIDEAVEKCKENPEPALENYWDDVYVKGHEIPNIRGRVLEEVHNY
jgi:pyruvate dehydrogenase E1 component alpha subunit